MNSRRTGLVLLNMAGILVILGSLYDLLVPAVPPNHLHYVGEAAGQLDPRYAQLDLAMLRSIGGCLLAIGMTTLIIANGPIRRGERWAAWPWLSLSEYRRVIMRIGCFRSIHRGTALSVSF